MTTIRKIVTSKIDGNSANTNDTNEIRPFGETAFYLDNNNKLALMIFDGVRTHQRSKVLSPGVLFGSNADAGDGSGSDTIKLIPDAILYSNNSDQYIVVDPTGGEPGHIHLRAGGTQDQSTADLYLGGELTCVRVSDTSGIVTVRTTNIGDPNITMDWSFQPDGNLYFPGIGNNRIGESEPGLVVTSDNSVVLQANNSGNIGEIKEWFFNSNGEAAFPGNISLSSARFNVTPTVETAGTIISVPLNAAGDTVDYTGGASVIEVPTNGDTTQVVAGWIITFNGGVQRTVSGRIEAGGYTSIYFNEANPGGTLYPLTIQSADYVAASDGRIDLIPNSANANIKLSLSSTGSLTLNNPGDLQFLDTSAAPLSVGSIASVGNIGFSDNTYQTTAWTGTVTKSIATVSVTGPTVITTDVVFGDSNAAGDNVNLVLPSAPATGKVITVKNINPGGNVVYIQTDGIDNMETESGSVGNGVYATLANTAPITWVYDGATYRIIG
jgi:hypothetical protein